MPSYLRFPYRPPPPYSSSTPTTTPRDGSTSPNPPPVTQATPLHKPLGLTQSKPPERLLPQQQLLKYLLEIVTYTLGADVSLVLRSLSQCGLAIGGQEAASILADGEKKELLRLALMVQDLYQKFMDNHWNLVLDCDKEAILHAIIRPAKDMGPRIGVGYLLDMIATYAEHQCDPRKRGHPLTSRYTLRSQGFWSTWASRIFTDRLGETLRTHALVISAISPDESVRLVLGQALADLQEKVGLKDSWAVGLGDDSDYTPTRLGFWSLYSAID